MSVLKLRRDMVVVEGEAEAKAAPESDRPFPLRTRPREEAIDEDVIEAEVHDEDEHVGETPAIRARKTFVEHVRFWFNTVAIVSLLGAYPAMVIASSDVGDHNLDALVERGDWSTPWIGGVSTLMREHFEDLGWASDAESWEPMARLTAKPAFQSAMAGSIGELLTLANIWANASGKADPDLEAAARLANQDATGIQMRAARDALVNHDRRLRRRDAQTDLTATQVAQELALIGTWADASQKSIIASATTIGGSPMDEDATRAVYAAKGRAVVAYILLASQKWPESPQAAKARAAAAAAWKHAAEFHPLVVLNGDPDGSLFGNHPAAMSFLIGRAEAATQEFAALVKPVSPAPALGASGAAP